MSCLPVIVRPGERMQTALFLVAVHPGEGLLTEPTPAVRPGRGERVFMTQTCRSQYPSAPAQLGDGVDAPRRHLRAKVTVSNCH